MPDIRQELATTADALAGFAKEASYTAIGAGVLAFHKAQVRRRELAGPGRSAGVLGGRDQMVKRAKDFDATIAQVIKAVDSTVEPVFDRLPESVQVVVGHAREARDDLRRRVFGLPAC